MRDKVQELESKGGVAVLVNNVGMSYSHPMWFHELVLSLLLVGPPNLIPSQCLYRIQRMWPAWCLST